MLFFILYAFTAGADVEAQVDTNLFTVHFLLAGMTSTIDIRQVSLFPLGCPRFLVFVFGNGSLGISLLKDDTAGDTIFMIGVASSAAGAEPICRMGFSKGMIDQIVEIGSASQPYGVVLLYGGVAFSQSVPAYTCQLRLSLAP